MLTKVDPKLLWLLLYTHMHTGRMEKKKKKKKEKVGHIELVWWPFHCISSGDSPKLTLSVFMVVVVNRHIYVPLREVCAPLRSRFCRLEPQHINSRLNSLRYFPVNKTTTTYDLLKCTVRSRLYLISVQCLLDESLKRIMFSAGMTEYYKKYRFFQRSLNCCDFRFVNIYPRNAIHRVLNYT